MKTRILAAAVLMPILCLVALVAPTIVAAVTLGILMAIGVFELLYSTGLVRHPRMIVYSALMAIAVALWSHYGAISAYAMLGVIVFWMLLFTELMTNHVKISVDMVTACFFGGAVVPYLLSAVIRILEMSNGRYLIPIPFVVAFMSDAGAYFVGLRYGKHKLAPVVSPNKTIEGMGGGIVSAMVGMLIYAFIMQIGFKFRVNYGWALVYGLLGSSAGVFGDLCFSVIKRQFGIKDYGNLIPGHGGFYDRFDSLVMVAPLMEAFIILLPVVM